MERMRRMIAAVSPSSGARGRPHGTGTFSTIRAGRLDRTMTRSDMVTASGIECVTISTVVSRVFLLCQMRISSSLRTSRVSSSRA
jgi:hypothetical protein